MKIFHIVRRFTPENWGGIEEAVFNLAMAQKELGHDVEILTTKALNSRCTDVISGITITRFDYFYPYLRLNKPAIKQMDLKGGDPFSFQMLTYIEKASCDILHCHTMGRLRRSIAGLAKKINLRFLSTLHGGGQAISKEESQKIFKPSLLNFPVGRVLSHIKGLKESDVDNFVCLSSKELNLYHKTGQNAFCIPNGVSFEFKKDLNINIRSKYLITEEKIVLCVSRIDRQKNQMYLIDSLIKSKHKYHLILCGPITDFDYYTELKLKINAYGLGKYITMLHGVKARSEELEALYSQSDVFALASIHEPFGIVLLEAWLMGLPVIANPIGGIEDLFRICRGHQLEIDRPDAFYQKVLETQNPNLKKNKEFNREIVLRHFSWRQIATEHIDIYKGL